MVVNGVNDFNNGSNLIVTPNPFNGYTNIRLSSVRAVEGCELQLMLRDEMGSLLKPSLPSLLPAP